MDDIDMTGKYCLCTKRCPANCSMYLIGGILFGIVYTAMWFFIAYQIDGEIKFKAKEN